MKIIVALSFLLLLAIGGLANGQSSTPTETTEKHAKKNIFELLGSILRLDNPILDLKPNTLEAVHQELQYLSGAEREMLLRVFCETADRNDCGILGIILCQCSFERFPSPNLGKPNFVDRTDGEKPTHPVKFEKGKPTITVTIYELKGFPEGSQNYLIRCIQYNKWLARGNKDKTSEQE